MKKVGLRDKASSRRSNHCREGSSRLINQVCSILDRPSGLFREEESLQLDGWAVRREKDQVVLAEGFLTHPFLPVAIFQVIYIICFPCYPQVDERGGPKALLCIDSEINKETSQGLHETCKNQRFRCLLVLCWAQRAAQFLRSSGPSPYPA